MAVEIISQAFEKAPVFYKDYEVDEWLRMVLNKANDSIYSKSMWTRKNRGMGTTAAGALVCEIGTYIFNAGDSRVYALYDGELIQMSEDHSYVQQLVKENKITLDEARKHSKRNTLTNALGVWRIFRIDINKIKSNWSLLLICSDGLHGYAPLKTVQTICRSRRALETKAKALIELANDEGGGDNITVVLGARDNAGTDR
jgi:protein phosphatase